VYLCKEVNDYRRSYLQNCGLESYKLQNVLGTSVMHECEQASNLGPRSFDHYSFALQNQPIGFKHLFIHTHMHKHSNFFGANLCQNQAMDDER
jgi:hypothetical protein